ncbi:MAG: hypothetical protein KAJ19_08380 [Gammaproteobacteria bacterium]|nr:hypothetical protein [Gammaproteobacteria bacterium]
MAKGTLGSSKSKRKKIKGRTTRHRASGTLAKKRSRRHGSDAQFARSHGMGQKLGETSRSKGGIKKGKKRSTGPDYAAGQTSGKGSRRAAKRTGSAVRKRSRR